MPCCLVAVSSASIQLIDTGEAAKVNRHGNNGREEREIEKGLVGWKEMVTREELPEKRTEEVVVVVLMD